MKQITDEIKANKLLEEVDILEKEWKNFDKKKISDMSLSEANAKRNELCNKFTNKKEQAVNFLKSIAKEKYNYLLTKPVKKFTKADFDILFKEFTIEQINAGDIHSQIYYSEIEDIKGQCFKGTVFSLPTLSSDINIHIQPVGSRDRDIFKLNDSIFKYILNYYVQHTDKEYIYYSINFDIDGTENMYGIPCIALKINVKDSIKNKFKASVVYRDMDKKTKQLIDTVLREESDYIESLKFIKDCQNIMNKFQASSAEGYY